MKSNKLQLPKNWAFITLVNLLVAALLGIVLRYKINYPLRMVNQSNLLHSHSHFVFHAWAGLALMSSFVQFLLPKEKKQKSAYGWIFWLMIATSIGMLVSFAIQGYGLFSILSSTIAQILFYWFTVQFMVDGWNTIENKTVKLFSFASLIALFLSTLGPYFLAYFSIKGPSTPLVTRGALYFYLHFQYNGWFSFAMLSLFFNWLHTRKLIYKASYLRWSSILLILGIIPGFALSLIGYKNDWWIYANAYFAVITQVIAVALICISIYMVRKELMERLSKTMKLLWSLAILALIAKTGMQVFSLNPNLALIAFDSRPLVIGYLHLIFLIMLTFFLFAYFFDNNQLRYNQSKLTKVSLWSFVIFSIISELFLFMQAGAFYLSIRMAWIPKYTFFVTIFMVLALAIFVFSQVRHLKELNPKHLGE